MNLATLWTSHLKDEEARKRAEQAIRNSTVALGRLDEILEQKEATLISQLAEPRFDKAWASETAHICGRLKEIRDQRELLKFIKDKR